jgi:acid phosphatase type 7
MVGWPARIGRPRLYLAAGLAVGLALGVGAPWLVRRLGDQASAANPAASTPAAAASEIRIAALGDMACEDGPSPSQGAACQQNAVSDAVIADHPSLLLAIGDLQYEQGGPGQWGPYDRSYGRLRAITRPVPGNHEYLTPGAQGYFAHFPEWAGPSGKGYYSFDIGGWHIVGLNSQCQEAGGCGTASPQVTWLRNDLSQHPARCTLAFWHIPRFSSGEHGDHTEYRAIWQTLMDHGADLVLAGHDHDYERLAKLDADGNRNDEAGLRSFVVGTGGRNLRTAGVPRAGSELLRTDAFGFLELRLRPDSYAWRFLGVGGPVIDKGEDRCH